MTITIKFSFINGDGAGVGSGSTRTLAIGEWIQSDTIKIDKEHSPLLQITPTKRIKFDGHDGTPTTAPTSFSSDWMDDMGTAEMIQLVVESDDGSISTMGDSVADDAQPSRKPYTRTTKFSNLMVGSF